MDSSLAQWLLASAKRIALGLSAVAWLVSSGCADDPLANDPNPNDPQQQLLFVTDRDGDDEIYRVNVDGTGAVNITNAPAHSYRQLDLSPDGTQVLFESDRSGCYNIWVAELDGAARLQLTGVEPGERCNEAPRCSPDGSKIAFASSRGPIQLSWEVWVMNADGTDPRNVSNSTAFDWPHTWTPDGRVVFHDLDGTHRTLVVDTDGTGTEPLFDDASAWFPYWSPDGSRVVFVSERDGNSEIYLMNADGTGVTNLTNHLDEDSFDWDEYREPWSPDGTRIALMSDREGDQDVFVMNPDGTGLLNVTNAPGRDVFNGWSPDGTRIAFSSDRSGDWEVYVVNADGTGLVNLTHHPASDVDAMWLPEK